MRRPAAGLLCVLFLAGSVAAGLFLGGSGDVTFAHLADQDALEGNAFTANATFARCEDPGPDAGGYTCAVVPYAFADLGGTGVPLALGADELSAPLALGFDFPYYGVNRTAVRVSSNGFLAFDPGATDAGCCAGAHLPDPSLPERVAPFWGDLDPSAGGTVATASVGLAPERAFVVQFTAVPHAGGSDPATFQVVLHEDGRVLFHYLEAVAAGHPHAAGLQGGDGGGLTFRFGTFDLRLRSVAFTPASGS